ncbi:roadblock/LC7 domain-containing protein [Streptomyces sp. NPDC086182]|uniref:roadblock/LC7 domain-containing protein n=1 Tax=Streptomyces sp. NPDC086182 TaxID=3155058 RepID=UPI00343CEDE1
MHNDGNLTTGTSAREQLSGLLSGLLQRATGATRALLAAGDGIKVAWSEQPVDDADNLAAAVSGLYSLGRQQFSAAEGGVRQVMVEHTGGTLLVMSAAGRFSDGRAVNTVLAVVAGPDADPGQVAYEMEAFVRGLDEHLVVQARPNAFSGSGL